MRLVCSLSFFFVFQRKITERGIFVTTNCCQRTKELLRGARACVDAILIVAKCPADLVSDTPTIGTGLLLMVLLL